MRDMHRKTQPADESSPKVPQSAGHRPNQHEPLQGSTHPHFSGPRLADQAKRQRRGEASFLSSLQIFGREPCANLGGLCTIDIDVARCCSGFT